MSVYVTVLIPGADGSDQYKLDMTITNKGEQETGLSMEDSSNPKKQGDFLYRIDSFVEGATRRTRFVTYHRERGIEGLVARAMEAIRE